MPRYKYCVAIAGNTLIGDQKYHFITESDQIYNVGDTILANYPDSDFKMSTFEITQVYSNARDIFELTVI